MGKFKDIWDRSKDGNRREQRSFVRYAIVATLLCLLFLCVKKDNLITWISSGVTLTGRLARSRNIVRRTPGWRNGSWI